MSLIYTKKSQRKAAKGAKECDKEAARCASRTAEGGCPHMSLVYTNIFSGAPATAVLRICLTRS